MAKSSLTLDIVSAERTIFSGQIALLIVSGAMGELGIMPGHSPLLTTLKPGKIRYKTTGNEDFLFYISGGILEVQPAVVTIIADTVIRAEDLDDAMALDAQQKAKDSLASVDKNAVLSTKQALLIEIEEATAMRRVIQELGDLRK
ncbi:MAG: F0F1 ATP synthase subunit epsilon [Gammaproteobacteria bacterium]|nr:F0F1 ATP synthase subunit epsilon [Gammaproteobacteria bacterium]